MKTKNERFSMRVIVGIILTICFFSFNSFSQEKGITIGEKFTIHSKILNEDREILVSVPDNYNESNKKHSVLYVLDGKTNFEYVVSAVNYLSERDLMPPMIVVAILNVDRYCDFTPIFIDRMSTSGGGKEFHNFIEKELFEFINKKYKTSDYNVLMGHTLGGTFATYSLLEFPDVFDAYIVVSPELDFADNYLIEQAKLKLKSEYSHPKSFYLTVGDEPQYFKIFDKFSKIVAKYSGDAINYSFVKMENEDRRTVPYLSVFNGLRFIFSDWELPKDVLKEGLAAVDKYYKNLSEKYGIDITTPEYTINYLGYNHIRSENFDKAIDVFKENVKRYPNSPNVYDSLGEAYEKSGQFQLAKDNYQKAYDLSVKQEDRYLLYFKANLDRMTKKLEK